MSTRAIYTFKDPNDWYTQEHGDYHVYKHHDGYPTGAAEAIELALLHSWQLPRFEADEFAAAFVAGNKSHRLTAIIEAVLSDDHELMAENLALHRKYSDYNGGGVRLMPMAKEWETVAPGDIEYRYEITHKPNAKTVNVTAYGVRQNTSSKWTEKRLFDGPLDEFKAWAKQTA